MSIRMNRSRLLVVFFLITIILLPLAKRKLQIAEIEKRVLGGLTQAQMQEDADFLWSILEKEYPYYGVQRRKGQNMSVIRANFMNQIVSAKHDGDFLRALNWLNGKMRNIGHFNVFTTEYTGDVRFLRSGYQDLANRLPAYQVWLSKLNDPNTISCYENLTELSEILYGTAEVSERYDLPPIETKTIVRDKIAYIKIESFIDSDHVSNRSFFANYWAQVSDYEHVIVDITGNKGGSDRYWIDFIVCLNIGQPVERAVTSLFNISNNNRQYLEAWNFAEVKPISQNITDSIYYQEDAPFFSHYFRQVEILEPINKYKKFNGKIWVLVDSKVFSAAEGFAMFCKETGFATLVGEATRGDGGNMDPILLSLPNSKVLVRYVTTYVLNPLGISSVEQGTIPDVNVLSGQTPLEACLAAIEIGK